MNYKYEIKPKELFPASVFPPQFAKLYEYIRYIPDDQEADYNYIEKELLAAAHSVKMDPSLLVPLDWMNYKPVAPSSNSTIGASPHNHQRGSRCHMPSQNTKNTATPGAGNGAGLKTPLITDKMAKK